MSVSSRTTTFLIVVFRDGTIVSGDSMGMVKFWDHITCTQLQSFTAHGADVLSLAIGPGNAVYTSGVDQKVVEFLEVQVASSKSAAFSNSIQKRWIQSCFRRFHSHDVRTLACWPAHSFLHRPSHTQNIAPLLVSGGLDTTLVISPCSNPNSKSSNPIHPLSNSSITTFEEGYYVRAPFADSVVSIASEARLIACRQDTAVSVWRILHTTASEFVDESTGGWRKLLEMELNFKTKILFVSISKNGVWLAVGAYSEVKLFELTEVCFHQ